MPGMVIGKKAMWVGSARTLAFCVLAVLVAALIGVFGAAKPAHARTFTVTNTNASGAGSLDQAIANANANNNTRTIDAIKFNIPTTDPGFGLTTPGVFTISSTSALPQITEPLSIDGYSQGKGTANTTADDARPNTLAVGNNAVLKVELRKTVSGVGTGLWIGAKNTTVKGLVINRWEEGVRISGSGSRANRVQGNYIGTDASGALVQGNSESGVFVYDADDNTIGGTTAGARNIIAGNDGYGILFQAGAAGNEVMGNYIGTDKSGTLDRGNSGSGVAIHASPDNTVGGTTVGARNIISNNDQDGVEIFALGSTGNRILSNSISDNGQLGIDLGNVGVTPNDTGDGDAGENNLQNFPELSSAKKTGDKTTVTGTLNSTAGTTFTIQFFSSLEKDLSGNGEGKKLIGQKSVPTAASGNASFTATTPVVLAGQVVSATATNQSTGDTSEFSVAIFAS